MAGAAAGANEWMSGVRQDALFYYLLVCFFDSLSLEHFLV
jgi:hypothetical protein